MNTETTQKNVALAPEEITQKDVTKAYLRWHFANEIPHSFDRYISASLLYAMMPILNKLYKETITLLQHSINLGWWGYHWFNVFNGKRKSSSRV